MGIEQQKISTTLTITGFTRDEGDLFGLLQTNGFSTIVPPRATISADVKIEVKSDDLYYSNHLDLELSCPQMKQLEKAIVEAVKSFRELERRLT